MKETHELFLENNIFIASILKFQDKNYFTR